MGPSQRRTAVLQISLCPEPDLSAGSAVSGCFERSGSQPRTSSLSRLPRPLSAQGTPKPSHDPEIVSTTQGVLKPGTTSAPARCPGKSRKANDAGAGIQALVHSRIVSGLVQDV